MTPIESGNGLTGFFYSIECSVNGSGQIVIPAFTIQSTTDGNLPTSRFTGQLFDQSGAPREIIFGKANSGNGWQIPTIYGTDVDFADLFRYNATANLLNPPRNYFTQEQTIAEILALAGQFDYARVGRAGITEMTTAPAVASHPKAVSDNDLRVPPATAFYYASHYDTFADALVSMGTSRVRLIVSESMTVGNGTVPSTVTLEFTGAGKLSVNNGTVLDIRGSIVAQPFQIFDGLGTVLLSSNKVQKLYQAAWWGSDTATTGAATSTALNAAATAVPSWSTLQYSNRDYTHAGLLFLQKQHVTFLGADSLDGTVDAGWGPRFIYTGTDGGDGLTTKNCYACTWKGFASLASPTFGSSTGAARNIYVTMDALLFPISSQNVFQSLKLQANNTRSDFVEVDIDNPSGTNNEFHQFHDCKLYGGTDNTLLTKAGDGIRIGHANAKRIIIERVTFSEFNHAINCLSGSYVPTNNTFNRCATIFYGIPGDVITVIGGDSEDCNQVLDFPPSGATTPFRILGGRYDNLHGAGIENLVANGRTTDPILRWRGTLTVDGAQFISSDGASYGGFTSNFINGGAMPLGSLVWGLNRVGGSSNDLITEANLNTGFNTFKSTTRLSANGVTVGGTQEEANAFAALTSTTLSRNLISVQANAPDANQGTVGALDTPNIGGESQIEIGGLARPMKPNVTYIGTNDGAQAMIIAVLARDAAGNRTMVSVLNQGVAANTTLSGSNYVHATWPKVAGRADYLLLQFSAGTWRTIATVTPSGTNIESYDIVANPAGAYTYSIPTYNETVSLKTRGAEAAVIERGFISLDATPSVIGASDFVTANAAPTTITTFDDGVAGQLLRVRVNDANTTFQNNSTIVTGSGADVIGINGAVYTFVFRASKWRLMGFAPAAGTFTTLVATGNITSSAGVFRVGANQVVGARETGWTTGSGTPNKGAYATYAGQNVSPAYVEAEAQLTDDAAKANAQRILAIEAALRLHGLIN